LKVFKKFRATAWQSKCTVAWHRILIFCVDSQILRILSAFSDAAVWVSRNTKSIGYKDTTMKLQCQRSITFNYLIVL